MKSLFANKNKSMFKILIVLLSVLVSCVSTKPAYEMPTAIDDSTRYVFFLHGAVTERLGAYADHPQYGIYNYYEMVKTISNQGVTVISELRAKNTKIQTYAKKVSAQVNELISEGVPPQHISVIGFSKGGAITLYVSSFLNNPEVNFVVMAGCGFSGKYKKTHGIFLKKAASNLRGRILSIYDTKDSICGTCEEAFSLATNEISSKEIKLTVGKGHGTFFQPRQEWLNPVMKWINESE